MEKSPERKAGPTKIVGADKGWEDGFLASFAEAFERNEPHPYEREHTPEERSILEDILQYLPEFVAQYGGTIPPFRPEHIHVVDPKRLTSEEQVLVRPNGTEGGYYLADDQQIVVFHDQNELFNAKVDVHELFHAASFHSYTRHRKNGEPAVKPRRFGLEIRSFDGKENYFVDLNEALTEELTRRFDVAYFDKIPELAEAIESRRKFREEREARGKSGDNIASIKTIQLEDGQHQSTIDTYSYNEQRYELGKLVGEIFQNNSEQFSDADEVFHCFAEAMFSGKLMEVARLIEGTRGKGAFRELANKTSVSSGEKIISKIE